MRSVRGIRNVLAMAAPALLVVVVGAGCGGDEASSRQELPDSPRPVATIGEGLVPGERRAPGPAPVTTTAPPRPIGRPSSPVPANHVPVTRPPLWLAGVVTTTSTSPQTTTAEPTTTTTTTAATAATTTTAGGVPGGEGTPQS